MTAVTEVELMGLTVNVHGRVVHGVIWMEWLGTGGLPKHLIRAASLAGAIQITQVTSFRKRQYLEFNFHAILP